MRKLTLMIVTALGLLSALAPASYAGGGPPGERPSGNSNSGK
jgi:hypothetical protein